MRTQHKAAFVACLILLVAGGIAAADGIWSIPLGEKAPSVWSIPLVDIPLDTSNGVTVAAVHWSIPVENGHADVVPVKPAKPAVPKPPNCACPECTCGPGCSCCDQNKELRYEEAYQLAKSTGKGVILSVGQPTAKRAQLKAQANAAGKLFAVEDFPPSVAGLELAAGVYDWGPPAAVAVESAVPAACQSCGVQAGLQSFAPVYSGGCANGRCGMR